MQSSVDWRGEGSAQDPRGRWHRIARFLLLAFLLADPALAQDLGSGVVQGSVRDEEGAGVYGATVTLLAGGRPQAAAGTDRLGSFRIDGVIPGSYSLVVQGLGYAERTVEASVRAGETITLEVRVPRQAIEVEGISVEAERSRERVRFEEVGGVTIREMSVEQVQSIPGIAEVDPVRAIEVLPGVVSTSDFSAAFHVRGGSADQNLILLDGIPIFSPFHLGGLFSVFNADMLDRVELQSGGFAAEHGGRVSSVLQIESDPGDGDFAVDGGVSVLATRLAVGGALPDALSSAMGHESVRYRVSARRSYFDVLFKPLFDFPYHLTDFQGVLEGWTHGGGRLTVSAYSGRDVLDLTRIDAEDFPLRIDWDWGNDLAGVRWSQPRPGGGALDLRANVSRFSTGLRFPDFDDTDFGSRILQAQLRGDLDLRPMPWLTLRTGASTERLSYRNRFASGGTEFFAGAGSGWLLASYLQFTSRRPVDWLFEAGVRLDSWHPGRGSGVLEISPRLAAKRFLGRDLALKAALGRYTQFLHSLRDEELPVGLDIWAVADARAPHVVSDQFQLGVEGYLGTDWFWSLEGYLRTFDGVIVPNTAENPNDELDDFLAGSGRSRGADLMVRRDRGRVNGWLALSVLRAERTFPDPLSPVDPPPSVTYAPIFDKRVDLDLVLRYPFPWGWEGGVRWNLGTGVPYTRPVGSYRYLSPRFVDREGRLEWSGVDEESGDLGNYGVLLGPRNAERYPMYHRLDLSLRKTIEKGWGTLTPYLNLLNVYNRRNVLFYFFQYEETPPVRSGISMFPVFPTFGVEVQF